MKKKRIVTIMSAFFIGMSLVSCVKSNGDATSGVQTPPTSTISPTPVVTTPSVSTPESTTPTPSAPVEVKYSVTYVTNGHGSQPQTVTEVKVLPETLPILTAEGYIFEGWYMNEALTVKAVAGSKITANTTLYAKWIANAPVEVKYSVTYVINGHGSQPQAVREVKTLPETLPVLTAEGYIFEGWYMNEALTVKAVAGSKITANTTLYAKWTENAPVEVKYSVTYVTNGHGSQPQTVTEVKALPETLPVLAAEGYTFGGWYLDEALTQVAVAGSAISANTTLYAKWIENAPVEEKYSVTYVINGHGEQPEVVTDVKTLPTVLPVLTAEGYTFEGWYLDEALTQVAVEGSAISANTTLYAKWKKIETTDFQLNEYAGYSEGMFAVFNETSVKNTKVSYSADSLNWIAVDNELIRQITSTTARVDIVGLKEGTYAIKVETSNGAIAIEDSIKVTADDRSGYAHFNNSVGVGAYNNDGTLKSNAVVVYVSEKNKNTVVATIAGKQYTGLANIIKAQSKSDVALDIRIIGKVAAATWNELKVNAYSSATTTTVKGVNGKYLALQNYTEEQIISGGFNTLNESVYSKLNGLTNNIKYDSSKKEFDSYYNMLDVSSAKNLTIEGIGTDAEIFQWGFTFKACNSVEVKNITFTDSPEDACSFEGGKYVAENVDSSNPYSGFNSANHWLHNCTFNIGKNYWDVCSEQDKHDGDGSSDLKYVYNVTLSYNKYISTHKTGLVGGSDNHLTANVTFHHNYYLNCQSRMPFARQANMHMYNNYYQNSTGTTMQIYAGAYAFIEACYFENDKKAFDIQNRNYTQAAVKSYNNIFNNSKATSGISTVTNRETVVSNGNLFNQTFDIDSKSFYYDSVNKKSIVSNYLEASEVPAFVKKYAGAGALGAISNSTTQPEETKKVTIQFDSNGGSNVSLQEVTSGTTITCPTPTKEGYTFAGWYLDSALSNKFVETTPITSNITLYAKWTASSSSGNTGSDVTTISHNFTASGSSSDFFIITGNLSTSKGTATYNGLTLTRCLKMESSTSVSFSISQNAKLVLVFGSTEGFKTV